MTSQQLIQYLQAERATEVLIDGKQIGRVDMRYGQAINLVSIPPYDGWRLLPKRLRRKSRS